MHKARHASATALGLAICFYPSTGGAQLSTPSQESQLRHLDLTTRPHEGEGNRFDFGVFGQVLGGAELGTQSNEGFGEAAIGAELLVSDDLCDTLLLGAQGRVHVDGARGLSFETWGSSCLMAGFPLPYYEIGHHLELNVRPALSARPGLPARRFNRESLQFRAGLLDLEIDEWRWQFAVMDVDLGLMWGEAHSGLETAMGVDVTVFRFLRPRMTAIGRVDVAVELFPVQMQIASNAYSEMAASFGIVRVAGVGLGDGGPYLDVQAGVAIGTISSAHDPPTSESTKHAKIATFGGSVSLYGGDEQLRAGTTLTREVRPTLLDQLVLDNRAELWGHLTERSLDVELRAFAAHSTVVGPDPAWNIQRHLTAGASLEIGHGLGDHAQVAVLLEGARSFYAHLDGDSTADPAWILRAQVALTAELDSEDARDDD